MIELQKQKIPKLIQVYSKYPLVERSVQAVTVLKARTNCLPIFKQAARYDNMQLGEM